MHRATTIVITLVLGLGAEGCKRCKYLHPAKAGQNYGRSGTKAGGGDETGDESEEAGGGSESGGETETDRGATDPDGESGSVAVDGPGDDAATGGPTRTGDSADDWISDPKLDVRDCRTNPEECGPEYAAVWSEACWFGRRRDRAQMKIEKRRADGKLISNRLQARYDDNRAEEESLLRMAAGMIVSSATPEPRPVAEAAPTAEEPEPGVVAQEQEAPRYIFIARHAEACHEVRDCRGDGKCKTQKKGCTERKAYDEPGCKKNEDGYGCSLTDRGTNAAKALATLFRGTEAHVGHRLNFTAASATAAEVAALLTPPVTSIGVSSGSRDSKPWAGDLDGFPTVILVLRPDEVASYLGEGQADLANEKGVVLPFTLIGDELIPGEPCVLGEAPAGVNTCAPAMLRPATAPTAAEPAADPTTNPD